MVPLEARKGEPKGRGCKLLDPRTFPVERIADLVHALPPSGVAIGVADAVGGLEAVDWLLAHGRPARLVPAPPEPVETRLWEPALSLSEWLVSEKGLGGGVRTALDLGCGTGRDAVFLALNGWRVTAVDRLSDALDRARSLAELHGVALDLRALDVEREELPFSEWLVSGSAEGGGAKAVFLESAGVVPQVERGLGGEAKQGFDLVTAFRYLPDLAKMTSALAPGGTLLVETFTDRERERTGKPRDPRLVLPATGPPPLPDGLVVQGYRVHEHGGRELATLRALCRGRQPSAR